MIDLRSVHSQTDYGRPSQQVGAFYMQKAYREQPQVGLNLQHEEPE
jgi:hypothetical protein